MVSGSVLLFLWEARFILTSPPYNTVRNSPACCTGLRTDLNLEAWPDPFTFDPTRFLAKSVKTDLCE